MIEGARIRLRRPCRLNTDGIVGHTLSNFRGTEVGTVIAVDESPRVEFGRAIIHMRVRWDDGRLSSELAASGPTCFIFESPLEMLARIADGS